MRITSDNLPLNALSRSRNSAAKKKKIAGRAFLLAAFMILIVSLAFIFNYRTAVNERNVQIDREKITCKREIAEMTRNIEHLKIQRENLSSWKYISTQVSRLNLNLKQPNANQVIALLPIRGKTGPMEPTIVFYDEHRSPHTADRKSVV